MSGPILVFDSGLGGVTVLSAIAERLPGERFSYLADDAGFPYGGWSDEERLVARIVELVAGAVADRDAKCAVIACNTAATIALPALRAALSIPVVGTVPAIKPAAERSRSGLVSVLATPATVARDYTRDLIARHGGSARFTLVGAASLAALAEAYAAGVPIEKDEIRRIIAPCFVEDDQANSGKVETGFPSGFASDQEPRAFPQLDEPRESSNRRTDVVVLACTHYPLLLDVFREIAPWPVEWIDPAPAIARRVASVLGLDDQPGGGAAPPAVETIFTSGRDRQAEIDRLLAYRLSPAPPECRPSAPDRSAEGF